MAYTEEATARVEERSVHRVAQNVVETRVTLLSMTGATFVTHPTIPNAVIMKHTGDVTARFAVGAIVRVGTEPIA